MIIFIDARIVLVFIIQGITFMTFYRIVDMIVLFELFTFLAER